MNPSFESLRLSAGPTLSLPSQNYVPQDPTVGTDYMVANLIRTDSQTMQQPVHKWTSTQKVALQFFQKSVPELEPEPIPFALADLEDIMDRDALTLDKDLLSVLARCA
jgi:hypothetical protein